MTEIRIGAGGWAYFNVPSMDPLEAYSKAFNFVEVNSTFYDVPPLVMVESWRRRVPFDFEFAIRCHRDLTHMYMLEPRDECFEIFNRMISICKTLGAEILHLETPASMEFSQPRVSSIRDFFSSINAKGTQIVWEIRKRPDTVHSSGLIQILRDFNITHSVDISKDEEPIVGSSLLYSRLFGLGTHNIYQFTDEELLRINRKASRGEFRKTVLSFHGTRMYKDAARLKVFVQTGGFPKVTSSVGLTSLKEVLEEDAQFPTKKGELIAQQGWKVIDMTASRRVHASKLLEHLREGTFLDIDQVLEALRNIDLTAV